MTQALPSLNRVLPAVALGIVLALPTAAAEPAWPSKPVRIIVPAPAGGGTADPLSRVLAEGLEKELGQRILIDNKPGANGNIGAAAAAQSAPDGYTLLFSWAGTLATNVSLYRTMQWHPQKDLDPIVLYGTVPNILVVSPSMPISTLSEFTQYAKANPGKINFASTGNGSSMHLSGELYRKMTETNLVHVPYNSPAIATTDLMSGNVQSMFQLITGIAGQVKGGKVKPIAVLSNKRSSVLPDVPTTAEAGIPGLESGTWFGLLAPKGTPRPIIDRMNAEVNKLLAQPAFRQKVQEMGMDPLGGTPEQFAKFLDEEIKRWAEVVKISGAKLD